MIGSAGIGGPFKPVRGLKLGDGIDPCDWNELLNSREMSSNPMAFDGAIEDAGMGAATVVVKVVVVVVVVIAVVTFIAVALGCGGKVEDGRVVVTGGFLVSTAGVSLSVDLVFTIFTQKGKYIQKKPYIYV